MGDGGRFAPDEPGAHPLFVDTSALYAYYYRRASQHEEMAAFFRELSRNDLPYRPLLTNRYVLDELVALLLSSAGHDAAETALRSVLDSNAISVLPVTDGCFADAVDAFCTYDDHEISLTDHTIALQAAERDVTHVLTYDDDFETLGFTVVPRR